MDLTAQIRRALEKAVHSYAQSHRLPLVPENTDTKQPSGAYLQTALLPADTVQGTLNAAKYSGIFQITVYAPQNSGAGQADEITSELINLFRRGGKFGVVAIRQHPSRSKGYMLDGRYAVVVSVPYLAIE
nr:MAG TPA: tail completion protein [Caudoviricetes sp.]